MIERFAVGILLITGVVLLLIGHGTVGIILLVVGSVAGVIFWRMENKRYSISGYYGSEDTYYVVKDAKLTDDRE